MEGIRERDRLADDASGQHARVDYGFAIGFRVPTVDAAARQVDDDVAAIQCVRPAIQGRTIP